MRLAGRVLITMVVIAGFLAVLVATALVEAGSESSSASGSVRDGHGSAQFNSAEQFALAADDASLYGQTRGRSSSLSGPLLETVELPRGPREVLFLFPRPNGYRLEDVAKEFPSVVTIDQGRYRIQKSIVVVRTQLVIGESVRVVELRSDPSDYVVVAGVEGSVTYRGSAADPLYVTSVLSATGYPDRDPTDGRSYLTTRSGAMVLDHVRTAYLGYNDGQTSGVSWMGSESQFATGAINDSELSDGRFGAYTSQVADMQVNRTQFNNNEVYGFDPHTGTVRTVVRDSLARGNGRHGFIFSKGCDDNAVYNSTAVNNGGVGFMIDDGNPLRSGIDASDRNILSGITAVGNKSAGVVIEGGDSNQVVAAEVSGSPIGLAVRSNATNTGIDAIAVKSAGQVGLQFAAESSHSRVTGGGIEAAHGVVINGSRDNSLNDIGITAQGVGIRLKDSADSQHFEAVTVNGAGAAAIRVDGDDSTLPGVTVVSWSTQTEPMSSRAMAVLFVLHPLSVGAWLVIICVPVFMWLRSRRHRINRWDEIRRASSSPG